MFTYLHNSLKCRKLELEQEEPDIIFRSFIKRPVFVETLKKVRDDPESFYTGDMAKTIVEDVTSKGGIMTLDDLKSYKVKTREPLKMKLKDLTLHTMPLPTGGPILMHILGICKGTPSYLQKMISEHSLLPESYGNASAMNKTLLYLLFLYTETHIDVEI